ncbi:MAG: TIGR01906 family membrane protein [Chloroflexi bacterium]|mgnify:CR=1 FL=1|nr:TIGR01906 family membrane protein [Chloroflexota bacterium]|tara:strand:+ start:23625 stop:24317 length:693 start_codon:yes stop_codon:yes gene_type:complete
MKITHSFTVLLFCISLPLFLLTTNVRILATNYSVYEFAFDRYEIEKNSGLDKQQLNIVGNSIIDYFQNDQNGTLLNIKIQENGTEYPLFSEREILHMYDVKVIMGRLFQAHHITFAVVIIYITSVFLWSHEKNIPYMGSLFIYSGIGMLAFLISLTLIIFSGFDKAFEQFHLILFSNDFWKLNPSTDALIQIFPYQFWLDITKLICIFTIVECLLLVLLGYLLSRYGKKI